MMAQWAWGVNYNAQCGAKPNSNTYYYLYPIKVEGLKGVFAGGYIQGVVQPIC